jgi:E3 ubiquitin-protein ligase RGLG
MNHFDANLPSRKFDNFRFVEFSQIEQQTAATPGASLQDAFALAALAELPEQFAACKKLRLLSR